MRGSTVDEYVSMASGDNHTMEPNTLERALAIC